MTLAIPPDCVRFDFLSHKHDPLSFYSLSFRVVRFKLSDDSFVTVITNVNQGLKIKEMRAAAMRPKI